jgi:hypothetical protein
MGRIFARNKKRGGRTWYIDYFYQGRRIRKKIGPSKKIAELVLKDTELKIARKEFNLAPSEISVNECVKIENCSSTKTYFNMHNLKNEKSKNTGSVIMLDLYMS